MVGRPDNPILRSGGDDRKGELLILVDGDEGYRTIALPHEELHHVHLIPRIAVSIHSTLYDSSGNS